MKCNQVTLSRVIIQVKTSIPLSESLQFIELVSVCRQFTVSILILSPNRLRLRIIDVGGRGIYYSVNP